MTEAPSITPDAAVTEHRILFVDDDTEFLHMIDRLMRLWSENRVEVVSASSASEALAAVQSTPPDLIVLDVCMPVVDGLQLLAIFNRRFPGIPKVVLTSQPDETYRAACLSNGAELFLEKPRTAEGFEAIFATLEELTKFKPQTGFRGLLRSVGLTDVIQMECIAKSSSVLTVTSSELDGAIFIRDGAIVHANAGKAVGEDAFKKLIALESGDFASRPFVEPPEQTIDIPWESLLMDAAQSRDELLGSRKESEPEKAKSIPICVEKPKTLVPSALPPIEIDELLICSADGDVYHAWQCSNTELRTNLITFALEKAATIPANLGFGGFESLEFITPGSRLVARLAARGQILLRSSLAGSATAKGDPWNSGSSRISQQIKVRAQQWFTSQFELPGLFAAYLQFANTDPISHVRSQQFTAEALEALRKLMAESFQVSKLQKFKAGRARWIFEQTTIESAEWTDNSILVLVFNRRAFELNQPLIERQLEEFATLESSSI